MLSHSISFNLDELSENDSRVVDKTGSTQGSNLRTAGRNQSPEVQARISVTLWERIFISFAGGGGVGVKSSLSLHSNSPFPHRPFTTPGWLIL